MENLIQGVLQYSRAGSGKQTIVPCNLRDVIEEVVDSIVVPEGFSVQVELDIVDIQADPTQVNQVFTNLISNAIKHHMSCRLWWTEPDVAGKCWKTLPR